jgi:hypothetical protein
MKQNSMRQYIESAKNNNRHLNFVDTKRFVNQPNMYANGAGAPASGMKKSMPYSILITSVSASNVPDFDVLGAYEYVSNAGFTAAGSLVIGSITISSQIPGVSYRELLYQSITNPFTVGQTYLSCANNAAQVQEAFTIITKDANGTAVTIPIVPATDPYQQVTTIITVEQEYRIDGFTKLRFSNILANAALNVRWYPSDNLNPARALSGQAVGKQFGDPGIIRK